jgi:hypothetical protein
VSGKDLKCDIKSESDIKPDPDSMSESSRGGKMEDMKTEIKSEPMDESGPSGMSKGGSKYWDIIPVKQVGLVKI